MTIAVAVDFVTSFPSFLQQQFRSCLLNREIPRFPIDPTPTVSEVWATSEHLSA
jgi:hypothetical protein